MTDNSPKTIDNIVTIVNRIKFMDRSFRVLEKGNGYLLQLEYYEPDIDNPTGPTTLQRSRKWYISPWMTETEIVETAFTAAARSMYHITKENFTYMGERVYSPHIHIDDRLEIAMRRTFDRRPDNDTRKD